MVPPPFGGRQAEIMARVGARGEDYASSSTSESSSFLVSASDPVEVAAALGASEAKLIGGRW